VASTFCPDPDSLELFKNSSLHIIEWCPESEKEEEEKDKVPITY